VALDPWRGYASALVTPLNHAKVVVDHAIRLANVVVDQVRRRVQQATLGHRGRKRDPLYRIRKLLLTAVEQLTQWGQVRLLASLTAEIPPVRSPRHGRARSYCGCRRRSGHHGGPCRAGPLPPLVGWRRGGGAGSSCSYRQGVGGRDAGLLRHWRLVQWSH
jgi:Transposase